MAKKKGKGSILKDTLALTLITLVAAVLLSLVREVTAGPIAKREEQDKQNAYLAVFREASVVKESKDVPELAETLKNTKDILSADLKKAVEINEICLAQDASGENLGYIVTLTDKKGFGGAIKMAVGYKPDGKVTGIAFLTIAETAGFGLEAEKNPEWRKQFYDTATECFSVTKTGAVKDSEIDALSGATITSKAVTQGINGGLELVTYLVKQGIGGVQ